MKALPQLIILCLGFSIISFGQTNIPEPFLKEIISQFPNVRDAALIADGNEVYFTVQSYLGELSAIVVSRKENNEWAKPEVAGFSGQFHDLEPFLSHDGLKLYFVSNRPFNKNDSVVKDYDIWYVQRNDFKSSWSAPVNLGDPVNTKDNEFYPCVTKSGNLYFTCDGKNSKGKDDIFVCKYDDGKYQLPVSVSDSINTEGYEFNAFVSPDENFMIYTCYNREGGLGSGDLYISYHEGNGKWTQSGNLGKEINSAQMDYCPFVDFKNRMMIFTSKRSQLNTGADTRFHTTGLSHEFNKYSNGQSRLYQVKFNYDFDKTK